jgi:hypothetical protein
MKKLIKIVVVTGILAIYGLSQYTNPVFMAEEEFPDPIIIINFS